MAVAPVSLMVHPPILVLESLHEVSCLEEERPSIETGTWTPSSMLVMTPRAYSGASGRQAAALASTLFQQPAQGPPGARETPLTMLPRRLACTLGACLAEQGKAPPTPTTD